MDSLAANMREGQKAYEQLLASVEGSLPLAKDAEGGVGRAR
jgi:hypothetical protein